MKNDVVKADASRALEKFVLLVIPIKIFSGGGLFQILDLFLGERSIPFLYSKTSPDRFPHINPVLSTNRERISLKTFD